MDEPDFPGDDAKAAAVVDIKVGEVEGQDEEQPAVDNHQLVVIAHQVGGGPRNSDAHFEQAHLELAQVYLAAPVGVRDQCAHRNAAGDRGLQRRLNLGAVETEDNDLDALLGASDSRKQRRNSVVRLDQQIHGRFTKSSGRGSVRKAKLALLPPDLMTEVESITRAG